MQKGKKNRKQMKIYSTQPLFIVKQATNTRDDDAMKMMVAG